MGYVLPDEYGLQDLSSRVDPARHRCIVIMEMVIRSRRIPPFEKADTIIVVCVVRYFSCSVVIR